MKIILSAMLLLLIIPFNAYADPDFSEEFKVFLAEEDLKTSRNVPLFKEALNNFYQKRKFEPVWFNQKGKELKDIDDYAEIIKEQADLNGLEFSDYDFAAAKELSGFEREWQLTNNLMHFINDLKTGRIDPEKYDTLIMTLPETIALDVTTAESLSAWNFGKFVRNLSPKQSEYKQLKEKLAAYRELEKDGGFPTIDKAGSVYPGETHEIIPQIRERLDVTFKEYDGKLPEGIWVDDSQINGEKLSDVIVNIDEAKDDKDVAVAETNPDLLYDKALAKRVAEFQYFHGIKADGVIGPKTIEVLNIPVSTRINQIKLSMERWRWLPEDLGKKHVRVNIAGFYTRAVNNGKDEFVMPIIVGKVAHQTPVFSSMIYDVKLHPDWTSPDSIAERYVIPKIKKNPAVINSLGYEILSKDNWKPIPWSQVNIAGLNSSSTSQYVFRQKPGKKNALGMARISIENDMSIFMHGTPDQSLFDEDDRDYSSGCIRMEDPFKMAYFLLKDQGVSKSKLEDLYNLEDGEFPDTNVIELDKKVPVHIMYMTAWVDQQGNIHFNEDIYGRDKDLNKALERLS